MRNWSWRMEVCSFVQQQSQCSWIQLVSCSQQHAAYEKSFLLKPVPTCTTVQSIGAIYQEQSSSKSLCVQITLVNVDGLMKSTLENIWEKAETLVSNGHVVHVPWSADGKDRLVKSSSSSAPHLVQKDAKKRSYVCEGSFPMFKGFSICSHVVATAEVHSELKLFLESMKSVCGPNLLSIADYGMPGGSGRKEGVIKRKRKRKRSSQPVETRSVCPSLDQIAFMSTSYPHISLPYNSIFQTSSLLHGSQAIPLTTYP